MYNQDYISLMGYQKGSPYAGNPYLDIHTPEGYIDMSNTPIDLLGIDNKGNKKKMKAGRINPYKFEGDIVREMPMKKGGLTQAQYAKQRGLKDTNNRGDFDNITPNQARQILHDKKVNGHPLTPEQYKLFGYLSKGNNLHFQAGGLNDPLRPKGLGVQAQDNTRPLPLVDPMIAYNQSLEAARAKQGEIRQAKQQSIPQQQANLAKKQAYVDAHPADAKLVNGEIERKSIYRNIAGVPDKGTPAEKQDRFLNDSFEALNAASIVMPVGELLGAGAKAAGRYLTEQTALKNAYKLNPLAFKPNPEAYYRMIGKEGTKDAFESGVIRANPNNIHPFNSAPVYDKPYFSVGKPLDRDWVSPLSRGKKGSIYSGPQMAEVNNASKFHPTNDLVAVPNQPLNALDADTKFYKENWLKGYKEVPKTQGVQDVYWNGSSYQSTPLSNPIVTRGAIDYSQEPNFRGRNPIFNAGKYGNSYKNPYVPPTEDPNLKTFINKLPIEDVRLPSKDVIKSMNNFMDIYVPLKKKQIRYKDMIGDNEAWKLGKEDIRLANNPSLNDNYISQRQQIDALAAAELQKLYPNKVIYNGMSTYSAKPTADGGLSWYGGMDDKWNLNSAYQGVFDKYKANPLLNTYEKAQNASRLDAGKFFNKEYSKYPIDKTIQDLSATPKNKLGGNIYKEGGINYNMITNSVQAGGNPFAKKALSMEQMFNYIFDDTEETKNIPTAPSTKEVTESEYDKAQKDLNAWDESNRANYQNSLNMVNNDYQNPNQQLYLYGNEPSGFQQFGSYQAGRQALEHQLELYQTGRTNNPVGPQSSILDAMSLYAPASDNNNPYAYAATISKYLGVPITTPISQIDKKKWADVIEKVEGNKKGNNPGNLRIYK